ncbi:cell division protein FtsL [Canicola haemoglobinophilus]|uniref:Cell division protein FtsL n=1 Tax=Canicola haemoglobinophilus TaxID=733 RepID=A0A1V4B2F0_9PAST|nr:cell division protein FtsL [Canicola haemoglobinophilus]OOS01468.1 cell division protein FtsL [Canicola haemoglobinophilus]STO54605.1 cell division protein [Canicola haemoglobinophilus]STO59922.1 cell division protein [Canicola haemoglobinophilus]STO67620.1 cell division protein [Canicola haemoglobinophilus]
MARDFDRYPLHKVILEDLVSANKLLIILIILVVLSALGTVWLTHQTRILISEKGNLILENQSLEQEYLNLRLEEKTYSLHSRIEYLATQELKMKLVPAEQEVLIIE